jgi:hypothetical protein
MQQQMRVTAFNQSSDLLTPRVYPSERGSANQELEWKIVLDPDLIFEARWQDLYLFLVSGEPPLILRLLAINTIFLVIYVIRRARQEERMKEQSVYIVQAFLIAANVFVMFGPDMADAGKVLKNII